MGAPFLCQRKCNFLMKLMAFFLCVFVLWCNFDGHKLVINLLYELKWDYINIEHPQNFFCIGPKQQIRYVRTGLCKSPRHM